MTGRWTFTPSLGDATREPPLPDSVQLEALRELLMEMGGDTEDIERFMELWWKPYLARRNDPDAEFVGNGVTFRISGNEVILTPLYEQWDDAQYVYVPVADVQDMLDQFAAYLREREGKARHPPPDLM